jgi:hypothetical protein
MINESILKIQDINQNQTLKSNIGFRRSLVNVLDHFFVLPFCFAYYTWHLDIFFKSISIRWFTFFRYMTCFETCLAHCHVTTIFVRHCWISIKAYLAFFLLVILILFLVLGHVLFPIFFLFLFFGFSWVRLDWTRNRTWGSWTLWILCVKLVTFLAVIKLQISFAVGTVFFTAFILFVIRDLNLSETFLATNCTVINFAVLIDASFHRRKLILAFMIIWRRTSSARWELKSLVAKLALKMFPITKTAIGGTSSASRTRNVLILTITVRTFVLLAKF